MRKLWNKYSYAIILIGISCISALIVSFHFHTFHKENYKFVTITEGDTLWEIADSHSGETSLSNDEFVGWIKKHNNLQGDQIYPGDEILIPVHKHELATNELASAEQ